MWEIHLRNIQRKYEVTSPVGELSVLENSSVKISLDEGNAIQMNGKTPDPENEQVKMRAVVIETLVVIVTTKIRQII